ncbi:MAG TPA: type II toxin-antitoxin system VapC family toxin [Verrucomicrobiae bacterium]|jgi:ribonuclease VapC|nr:type II toxin-antitoxin system VapC family toxin [Verrucomicrobiae bacterium]
MNRVVLDASAILAVIGGDPGAEKLTPDLLARAVGSAVNLSEVQAKLVSRGWPFEQAWEDATSPVRQVLAFDEAQARVAGDLATQTRYLGLSLGDRACLALGIALKVPVYTAEKAWKKLNVGITVHVIR